MQIMEFYIIFVYPALHNIFKMPSDSKETVRKYCAMQKKKVRHPV